MEPKTITLKEPLTLGAATYPELVVREPTAGEWAQWDGLPRVPANIKALSIVCGVPEPLIKQLGVIEFNRAVEALNSFFDLAETKAD